MAHPPTNLRRLMAQRSHQGWGLFLLLLLFPLAYVIRLLFLLVRAALAYLAIDAPNLGVTLLSHAMTYVRNVAPIGLAMIALVLLWPYLCRIWVGLFTGQRRRPNRLSYPSYLGVALCVALLLSPAYLLKRTNPVPPPAEGVTAEATRGLTDTLPTSAEAGTIAEFEIDAQVEVEWEGKWWPARILDIADGLYLVTYDGFDSSWDEWVDGSRVRVPHP